MMSRRILFSISLILVCFLSTFVSSANITVHVGGKDEKTGLPTLSFRPQNVTVVKGDTIVWLFDGGNHNVVQSDGPDGSCELSTATDAFQSVTNPPTKQFTLDITKDKGILWYLCSVQNHCSGGGMWGIIYIGDSAPKTTSAAPLPSPAPSSSSPSPSPSTPSTDKPSSANSIKNNNLSISNNLFNLVIFSGSVVLISLLF